MAEYNLKMPLSEIDACFEDSAIHQSDSQKAKCAFGKTYLYTTMSMTKMIRSKDVLQSNG